MLLAGTVAIFLFYQCYYAPDAAYVIAQKDSFLSAGLAFVCIWVVYLFVKSYPTPVAIITYALIISSMCSIVGMFLNYEILQIWLVPKNQDYALWFHHSFTIKAIVLTLVYISTALYTALYKKNASLDQKLQLQNDASTLLRDAELFKLRQQLQPHFLYNSLNSISSLIIVQPEKAREMISLLSDFLRNSVKREAEDKMPLKDELDYLKNYLEIETIRFGERLNIIYEGNLQEEAYLPPLLLQPLLENAIKYGLYGTLGTVAIVISIKLEDAMLHITISNPYDQDSKTDKGTGFGLESIRRRLYLLYGRTDLLETKDNKDHFITHLKIPQMHV